MSELVRHNGIPKDKGFDDTKTYRLLRGVVNTIEGPLIRNAHVIEFGTFPEEGPALIVSNHAETESVILVPWAVNEVSGRSTRMVVRHTLLDPSKREEPFVLERTGKGEDIFNGHSDSVSLSRRIIAGIVTAGADPIPVQRGGSGRDIFHKVRNAFEEGSIVGMFIQETRSPEDDLRNALPGAAFIAKQNPDIPIYVTAITNALKTNTLSTWRNPYVTIGTPFTFRGLDPTLRMPVSQLHELLLDKMTALLKLRIPNVLR